MRKLIVALAAMLLAAVSALVWYGYGTHKLSSSPVFPVVYPAFAEGAIGLDIYLEASSIHLLLALANDEPDNKPVVRLVYARSEDGGATWMQYPIALAGQAIADIHRGNDPQLAVIGRQILVGWQLPHSNGFGGGPLQTARSDDGGQSWQLAGQPADSGREDDQGYFDLLLEGNGSVHVVWLDDREERGNVQGVRYATSTDGGMHWSANQTLASSGCTCCWTQLARGGQGRLYALYRAAEPRDMMLSGSTDHGSHWQSLSAVGAFDWQFIGCPHDGGALSVVSDKGNDVLHTVIWTGKEDREGLYYLFSVDNGATWAQPVKLGGASARFGAVAATAGHVAAAWTLREGGGSQIRAESVDLAGHSWGHSIALSVSDAKATHPRIVAWGDGFRVFWTERRAGRDWLAIASITGATSLNLSQ